jgi:hypothetical protein
MGTFATAVGGWHDFYVVVGTAAATLVGLLFVSLSLNPHVIAAGEDSSLRVLATQTFANFLLVLMIAVVFLIPDQGPLGLGLPLLGIGAYGLYLTSRRLFAAWRSAAHAWGKGGIARHVAAAAVCNLVLLAVAVSALLGSRSGLYWLVPVILILLYEAARNAWHLLLELHPGDTGISSND